jgi:GNAT superfamily N-acetyltransferase
MHFVLIAARTVGIAGFISLRDGTRISQFFVQPRHQGQGLGRRLWDEAQRRAGISDSTEITVDSSRGAVAVYERFGFAAVGPAKQEGGVIFVPMLRAALETGGVERNEPAPQTAPTKK